MSFSRHSAWIPNLHRCLILLFHNNLSLVKESPTKYVLRKRQGSFGRLAHASTVGDLFNSASSFGYQLYWCSILAFMWLTSNMPTTDTSTSHWPRCLQHSSQKSSFYMRLPSAFITLHCSYHYRNIIYHYLKSLL